MNTYLYMYIYIYMYLYKHIYIYIKYTAEYIEYMLKYVNYMKTSPVPPLAPSLWGGGKGYFQKNHLLMFFEEKPCSSFDTFPPFFIFLQIDVHRRKLT